MESILKTFEKYISYILLTVGMLMVIYQTMDLIYEVFNTISASIQTRSFIHGREGHPVAALFFTIMLTLEIMETVRLFSKGHLLKIRVILLVGLIAITRKILLMDITHPEPVSELTVAALILALSIGYFLVSRSAEKNLETENNK